MAVTSLTPAFAPFFLAVQARYFRDVGLTVNVQTLDPTVVSAALLCGKEDIVITSPCQAIGLAQAGKSTSMIYNLVSTAATYYVAGKPQYKSIADCKKINTTLPNTGLFSAANSLKELFHAHFVINDVYSGSINVNGAAMAGQFDCVIGLEDFIKPPIFKPA